jgi:hypothetical protein
VQKGGIKKGALRPPVISSGDALVRWRPLR